MEVVAAKEGITLEVSTVKENITLKVVAVEEGTTLEVAMVEKVITLEVVAVEAVITMGAILPMVKIITLGEAKSMGKDITPEVWAAAVAISPEGEATVTGHGTGATTPADREDRGPTLEEEAGEGSTPEVLWTAPRCPEDWRSWRGFAIYGYLRYQGIYLTDPV